jgi:uncharacterized protein (UPF0147 family)
MPPQNGLRLDDGDRATPRRQHARADEQLQPVHEVELRALAAAPKNVDLVAEDGVSMISSRRGRTASTATPAISLADLRGASCDHNRPTRPRTHVRIRVTLGKRIPYLEHERGSRWSPCAPRLPPCSRPDAQGSQHSQHGLARITCLLGKWRPIAHVGHDDPSPSMASDTHKRSSATWTDLRLCVVCVRRAAESKICSRC